MLLRSSSNEQTTVPTYSVGIKEVCLSVAPALRSERCSVGLPAHKQHYSKECMYIYNDGHIRHTFSEASGTFVRRYKQKPGHENLVRDSERQAPIGSAHH